MPVVGDPGGARLPRHFDADVAEVGGAEDGNRRRRIDVVVIVAVLDRHEEETSHLIEVAKVEVAEVGKRLWDANDLDSRGRVVRIDRSGEVEADWKLQQQVCRRKE